MVLFHPKLNFQIEKQIVGKNGRYIILDGTFADNHIVLVNIYAPKGICKTRTGWLRMADADGGWENADGKMRMEKCGRKKK